MKQVNGIYGRMHRNHKGGRGYVFQGRFKSLLIQEGAYLTMASVYVLINCVEAGIVADPFKYKWSSINEYFTGRESDVVDSKFMEEVFGSKEQLRRLLREWSRKKLPIEETRFGNILGDDNYIMAAKKMFDRRKGNEKSKRMRSKDYVFETTSIVIKEFENKHGVKIDDINTNKRIGKRLRAELLVVLKDRAGLSYREIIEMPIFMPLKYSALAQIYRRAKKRMEELTKSEIGKT